MLRLERWKWRGGWNWRAFANKGARLRRNLGKVCAHYLTGLSRSGSRWVYESIKLYSKLTQSFSSQVKLLLSWTEMKSGWAEELFTRWCLIEQLGWAYSLHHAHNTTHRNMFYITPVLLYASLIGTPTGDPKTVRITEAMPVVIVSLVSCQASWESTLTRGRWEE